MLERRYEKVFVLLEQYGRQAHRLIPLLQAIQAEYRYLPEEVLSFVAASLDIPLARVYGVATFYPTFSLEPRGKHCIRLCDGTACHVKRSQPILAALYDHLGLSDSQTTSSDMLFTVETVHCLGACNLGPVVMIDDELHAQMTPAAVLRLVSAITAREQLQ